MTEICWFHVMLLTLVVLNDEKNCIFRHEFIKLLKITVSRKCGWKFNIRIICVSFDNITMWHVYSFAYQRFNWHDGIICRYSYISLCKFVVAFHVSYIKFKLQHIAKNSGFWGRGNLPLYWKFWKLRMICLSYIDILIRTKSLYGSFLPSFMALDEIFFWLLMNTERSFAKWR